MSKKPSSMLKSTSLRESCIDLLLLLLRHWHHHLCDPEDPACEPPNMAVRGLVYGPELDENVGVVLGGVVDTKAIGAGMNILGGRGMRRYGIGWNG